MAKKIYEVVAKTREWTNQNGEKKGNWLNVGAIWENDDGDPWLVLNRHFNPAGLPHDPERDTVSLSLFKPRPQEPGV